jgi:ribosomal-protein-alanine N-acetyltransferase
MAGFIAGDANSFEGIGWITTLGVAPEFRRQGVAELLLVECERRLSQPRLRLSVRKSNEAAIQLYAKHGYSHILTWPQYYQDKEDGLVLEKKIEERN